MYADDTVLCLEPAAGATASLLSFNNNYNNNNINTGMLLPGIYYDTIQVHAERFLAVTWDSSFSDSGKVH